MPLSRVTSAVLAFGLGISCLSTPARALDQINWLIVEEASWPGKETDGQVTSLSKFVADQLSAHMTGFTHHFESMPVFRVLSQIPTADGYCSPEIYKTADREKSMLFSLPLGEDVPHRIVIARSKLGAIQKYLDGKGRVRLVSLINDGLLLGAREGGAVMGPEIDPLFVEERFSVINVAHMEVAYTMLAGGRLDWVMSEAMEASVHLSHLPNPGDYVTLALSEQSHLQPHYAVCSNGPLGRKAIAEINAAIRAAGAMSPWEQKYLDLLDPDSREEYWRLKNEVAKK